MKKQKKTKMLKLRYLLPIIVSILIIIGFIFQVFNIFASCNNGIVCFTTGDMLVLLPSLPVLFSLKFVGINTNFYSERSIFTNILTLILGIMFYFLIGLFFDKVIFSIKQYNAKSYKLTAKS